MCVRLAFIFVVGILGAYIAFHANYLYKRPLVRGVPIWGGDIRAVFAHSHVDVSPEENSAKTPLIARDNIRIV